MSEVLASSRNLNSGRFGFGLLRQKYVWLAMTPFVVLLLIAVYRGVQEWRADQAIQLQIDKWAKADVPYDNASLQKLYLKRTFPEGNEDWARAIRLSQWGYGMDFSNQLPYLGNESKPPAVLVPDRDIDQWTDEALVAGYLDEMQPWIDLVERASKHPTPVQFPMDFQGFNTLLPHIQMCRSIHRVLALDCEYAYSKNDTSAALRDLSLMRATTEAFDSRYFLVQMLVINAVRGIKLRSIRRTLTHCAWDESQLAAIRELMSVEKDHAAPWQEGVTNERAMALASLKDLPSVRVLSELTGNGRMNTDRPIMPSDIQLLMEYYDELIGASGDSILRMKKRAKEVMRRCLADHPNSIAAMFLPATESVIASGINVEETRRWTLVAVALQQHHQQHGSWPQQLSDLETLGLVFDDYSNMRGEIFGYEVDGEKAYLWKRPDNSSDEIRISPKRPIEKEDGVHRYRQPGPLDTYLLELHAS